MSNDDLVPGARVTGFTPGRYAKEFTGTYLETTGEGVNKFAVVKLDNERVIRARPKTLIVLR